MKDRIGIAGAEQRSTEPSLCQQADLLCAFGLSEVGRRRHQGRL